MERSFLKGLVTYTLWHLCPGTTALVFLQNAFPRQSANLVDTCRQASSHCSSGPRWLKPQVARRADGASPCRWSCEVRLSCYFGVEGSGRVLPEQQQVTYKPIQEHQPQNQRKRASQNTFVFNLCLSRRVLITPTHGYCLKDD